MNEEPSFFWLSILTEVTALLLLFSVIFIFFIRREKKYLLGYVSLLRKKVKDLKRKLSLKESNSDIVYELLNETATHIKESYENQYGHSIDNHEQSHQQESSDPNAIKRHFIYVFAYQAFVSILSALDNSNTASSAWVKIEANLQSLVEVFKVHIPPKKPDANEDELSQQKTQHDLVKALLEATIEYIKEIYQDKFGHAIGERDTLVDENNSKEHFLFVFGYQALKAISSALDNSNAPEKAWNKIAQQLDPLIENYRIMPEKEFLTIIEEKVNDIVIENKSKGSNRTERHNQDNDLSPADKSVEEIDSEGVVEASDDLIIQERKKEIERLKNQIKSQSTDLNFLKDLISKQIFNVNDANDSETSEVSEALEIISKHLKDAEFCISIMEANEQTLDEEIKTLKSELKMANAQLKPVNSIEMQNELKKKEQLIARFSQESKEMLSLIDGMEKDNDEKAERINELKIIEEKYKALTSESSTPPPVSF
ncbi:MAG: hypothetical protein HQL46_15235 [Gammaproteobacteria bacterium]|nr:hypothetical protein [Gammaproteobacteria bacterium]